MADQQTVFRSVSSYPSKIKISFSNGKEPLIEDFGTPQWISELSTIVDEVRDRTILVKINSPLHSWSDSRISLLFSEIGVVEDLKHLPPGSGFNFQVRFQSTYDSEWAYCYFNGTFLHQGCCELEICRADDLVTWNIQRVAAIKVAFGIRNTPGTKNDDSLLEEVNQIEDTTEVLRKNELDVVNEHSDFSARQVLNKMPKSCLNGELILMDEMEKIKEELVDCFAWEAPPMGSVEELDGVKVFEEAKLRDVAHKTSINKLQKEFHQQEVMLNGVVCVICFDPGGDMLLPREEFAQSGTNEPTTTKEFSHLVARQVFDKILEPKYCHFPELFNEIKETKVFSVDFLNPDEYFDAPIEKIDELVTLPTQRILRFIYEDEKKVKNSTFSSLTDRRKSKLYLDSTLSGRLAERLIGLDVVDLEVKSKDEELIDSRTFKVKFMKSHLQLVCFDPGGSLLPFDISNRKITEMDVLVRSSSRLQDTKSIYISSPEKLIVMTSALVKLACEAIFQIVYALLRGSVACLDVFCFDPGGGIYLTNGIYELTAFITMIVNDAQLSIDANKETLIFDPGGLLVLNKFWFLAVCEQSTFNHTIVADELELGLDEFSCVGYDSHGAGIVVFDPGGDIEGSMLERLRFGYALSYLNSVECFKWVAYMISIHPTASVELLKLFDMKGRLIFDFLGEKLQVLGKNSIAPILLFLCSNLVRMMAVRAEGVVLACYELTIKNLSTSKVLLQVPVGVTSIYIIIYHMLGSKLAEVIVYTYDILSTQVGDMELREWAYAELVGLVFLAEIFELVKQGKLAASSGYKTEHYWAEGITGTAGALVPSNKRASVYVFDPGGEHVQPHICRNRLQWRCCSLAYNLEDKVLLNKGELIQEYGSSTRFSIVYHLSGLSRFIVVSFPIC